MSVFVYTGKPGTGKTYYLAYLIVKFLKQGKDVFTNIGINYELLLKYNFKRNRKKWGRLFKFSSLEQFRVIQNGVIIMDEAQTYFRSRSWKDLPKEIEIKFQEHRKDGLDIYLTSQHINRIETIIRELANYCFELKLIGFRNTRFCFFLLRKFEVVDITKAERRGVGMPRLIRCKKSVYSFYNTKEKINVNDYGKLIDTFECLSKNHNHIIKKMYENKSHDIKKGVKRI